MFIETHLPDVCPACGDPSVHRSFHKSHPQDPEWPGETASYWCGAELSKTSSGQQYNKACKNATDVATELRQENTMLRQQLMELNKNEE